MCIIFFWIHMFFFSLWNFGLLWLPTCENERNDQTIAPPSRQTRDTPRWEPPRAKGISSIQRGAKRNNWCSNSKNEMKDLEEIKILWHQANDFWGKVKNLCVCTMNSRCCLVCSILRTHWFSFHVTFRQSIQKDKKQLLSNSWTFLHFLLFFRAVKQQKHQVLWFKMLSFLDFRFCHWKTTISSPCHPRWTHFLKRKQHSSFAVSLDALHWTPGWGLNFARSTTNWRWFVGFIVSLYDYRGSWTCS